MALEWNTTENIIKIFQKFKKNQCKKYRDKLDEIAEKYRDKSVQQTITSIIISHTHAPLQLCSVTP